MKNKGRPTNVALLRTEINKKSQTYSHKRLLKDLIDIQNEKIPTVGVTARPLDNDLFTWHANIKGPQGTLYEGGVFHAELKFPLSYPHHPPTITIFNKIPHPNIFDNFLCFDMLMLNQKRQQGQGWSSAYTVQSILTQLQSFLFEENLSQNKQQVEIETKKALKQANIFACQQCKHKGKISCWPSFSQKQNQLESFKILEQENQVIKKQLICYHTKVPWTENQLGLGLIVTKVPRTGKIGSASTFNDYISIKAFIKQCVRKTSTNQRITHWIPIYFGKEDKQQKFLKFLTKSLSMIMTNSTRNFKQEFILEVMPKLMITIIYQMMDEKKHASIRSIRILTHIHSIFLFLLKKFPELKIKISELLSNFIKDSKARIKQNQPNLGCVLAMLSVTDSHKFSELAEAYFLEQLDRQVLWVIKAIPEILDQKIQEDIDKQRARVIFKTQMTSFHIFCFYRLFIVEVCQSRVSRGDLLEFYESNLCKLTNKQEEYFQKKIIQIQKNITSFEQFFNYTGLPKKTQSQLTKLLKTAIKNSQQKKYHGSIQVVHQLPPNSEQINKLLLNVPSYKKYFQIKQITTQKQNKKKDINYDIKCLHSTEEDWRNMCVERWAWIRQTIINQKESTANDISQKSIDFAKNGIYTSQDRLTKIINSKYKCENFDYRTPKIHKPIITWRQLFLKLDLQDFLTFIDINPDFTSLYQKLQLCRYCKLNTLLIPLVPIKKINSGYYYLTSILTKLTDLKYLQFTGLPQKNKIQQKCAKAIQKGFKNFIEQKGLLQILVFHNIYIDKDLSEYLFEYLNHTNKLQSLKFQNTNIFVQPNPNKNANAMKSISKILTQMKQLEELNFIECQFDEQKCRVLADSLVRAKMLRIFKMVNTKDMNNGLSSLIYNFTFFTPNLQVLDISNTNSNLTETISSLYKLLKITTSLEILLACNIKQFNQKLSDQFWISLGECPSLRVLDSSKSGIFKNITQLGNAIAFNAKKKGVLQYVNFTGCIQSCRSIQTLYEGMRISQYDEQNIYGDPTKAAQMIRQNRIRIYYNNLKALQLDHCSNLNVNFNLENHKKWRNFDPPFARLMNSSKQISNIYLSNNQLKRSFAEMLTLVINPNHPEVINKIIVLDLSKNEIEKAGIKALASILPKNQIIRVLDLSKNKIGVLGAKQLANCLKNNKSLKFLNVFNNKISYQGAKQIGQKILLNHPTLELLQIGHNRIRDKGLKTLIDNITKNEQSQLKYLGIRFNFITSYGATYLVNKLSGNKTKLQQIFLRNNLIDDAGLYNLNTIKEYQKLTVNLDILQKLKFLEQDKLDRTIWIHPIQNINLQNLKQFFQTTHNCGIVLQVRVKRSKKYPGKNSDNIFGFVEFADPRSVDRALLVASQKLTIIDGKKFRVYKAGTGTFLFVNKTGKQKKIQIEKANLTKLPYIADKNSKNQITRQRRHVRPQREQRRGRIDRSRSRSDRRRPQRNNREIQSRNYRRNQREDIRRGDQSRDRRRDETGERGGRYARNARRDDRNYQRNERRTEQRGNRYERGRYPMRRQQRRDDRNQDRRGGREIRRDDQRRSERRNQTRDDRQRGRYPIRDDRREDRTNEREIRRQDRNQRRNQRRDQHRVRSRRQPRRDDRSYQRREGRNQMRDQRGERQVRRDDRNYQRYERRNEQRDNRYERGRIPMIRGNDSYYGRDMRNQMNPILMPHSIGTLPIPMGTIPQIGPLNPFPPSQFNMMGYPTLPFNPPNRNYSLPHMPYHTYPIMPPQMIKPS